VKLPIVVRYYRRKCLMPFFLCGMLAL